MANRVSKRKAEVKKRLIMFMNSWLGESSAAIFEIPIKLTCGMSVDDDGVVSLDSSCCYEGQILKPIDTFYSRTETPNALIRSVGACVLGSELYMFPDDGGSEKPSYYRFRNIAIDKNHTIIPTVYDLAKRSSKDLPFLPDARKMGPIVTVVGRELFVLSAYSERYCQSPQPGFEALHLDKHTRRELALCPIHVSRPSNVFVDVTGHAVLGADFLLLSVNKFQRDGAVISFYTYSFQSNLWKNTNSPSYMEDIASMVEPAYLSGQALVVGPNIYTFCRHSLELAVFSYSKYTGVADYDIQLDPFTVVHGLTFENGYFPYELHSPAPPSSAIAQVEDGILCLLHMGFLNMGGVIAPFSHYLVPPLMRSVGACVSGTELYMFPDDGGSGKPSYYQSMNLVINKNHTLIPGVYDLAKKSSTPYKDLLFLPDARKTGPIVTVVGRELFD